MPPFKGRRGVARICNYPDVPVNQFIKAWIVCGAVHKNGMGPAYTDKLFQPFLKPFPVYELL